MDRVAGLALAGAGLGAAGLGVAAATGNLPVSKQQQVEELKAQGIVPPPELEKEAQDEQLAMLGMAALAMGGGVAGGPGFGGGHWSRGADGAPVPPPGGSGPRPGGGSRMAAEPSTVELVSRLAASSPQMAAEVQAILDRKAGIAPPLRVEARRFWAPAPETEFLENGSGLDLPELWYDSRETMLEDAAYYEKAFPSTFAPGQALDQVIASGIDRSPEALADIARTVRSEYTESEKDLIDQEQRLYEDGPRDRTYVIPRNITPPNEIELGLSIPVDASSLREIRGEVRNYLDLAHMLGGEAVHREARYNAGDYTYWQPAYPFKPSRDSSLADRRAYEAHSDALGEFTWKDYYYDDGTKYPDKAHDPDLVGLKNSLYGGQPVYNQPDPPRVQRQRPRRRGPG